MQAWNNLLAEIWQQNTSFRKFSQELLKLSFVDRDCGILQLAQPGLPTSSHPRPSTSTHTAIIGQIVTYCTSDGASAVSEGVQRTGAALAANPQSLQTDLSCPACIASCNFILEFPSINSRSRLFSRWRKRARSVEQTTSLARACVNVRIGEFMLGNSRTKLPAQCMLGRRSQFEGVANCNAERCQPCI